MRWDIFCQIVDNYGDAGVCWRLARSLATHHQQQVRLFCDDLPTLNLLASDSPRTPQVEILPWEASFENARHPLDAPDVVIEAFACELPAAYIAAMAARQQKVLWLNLEYLSAEAYVERSHRLASPQFAAGYNGLGIPTYRVVNDSDLVPEIPPAVTGDFLYQHLGLAVSFTASYASVAANHSLADCYLYALQNPQAPMR